MKKRMLSILLTLCMVLSLLPTTAMASNEDSRTYYDVDSWTELQDAINNIETIDDTYDAIRIQPDGFLWPEDACKLTIDFKNNQATDSGGQYQIYLTGSDTMGTSFLGIQTLTINGRLATNLSPTQSSMNDVVIGSGAKVDIRGPWSVYDLTLADGVTLTGSSRIYLYGDLTAAGSAAVSNYIQLYASSAFSGNLTLGDVGINSFQAPTLTIAENAEVSVNYLYVTTAITVNGTLNLKVNRYTSSSSGTLTVNSGGTVRMNPNMTYGNSSTDTGSITGSGTLELYALLEEVDGEVCVSAAPTIFGVYSNQKGSDGAYAAFPANVADSVNIVRKWDGCSHTGWSDPVIVAPTCTEEGYTVKTCTGCGMEMRSDYTPATGHKNRTFSATQYDNRVKVTCDDCGADTTIGITSASKVLLEEGVPAKPASFSGYSGWYTADTLPAIVYENNTAPGFAYDDGTSDVIGTVVYAYSYEQYSNVGSYAINVSGLTAQNYNITFAPGTLTVSKATVYTIALGNLSQRDNDVTPVTAAIAPQDSTAQITVEYLVGDHWTAAVPTTAGEYQVRACLTVSDNIQTDGKYTTGTLALQRSVVVDDTDVSVIVDGGSGSGLYLAGDIVAIRADSKGGYTFAGWEIVSGNVALTDAMAAETAFTMPAADVELRATYTKNTSVSDGGGVPTYTLTFDTNGGCKIDSVTKASGAAVDLTGYVPTRTGYDFGGWYSNTKLTDKIISVTLTRSMTVYAKWAEKGGENPFTDVADDAYYDGAVIWAVSEGITSGTTAATFAPNAACTRAQAVAFLWRAAGSPAPKSSVNPFADVKADAYYYDAVLWAVEQGITNGTGATTFSPDAACTQAQIVTFLWRAQKAPAADGVNPFADVAADAYYNRAVLWAVENGITAGTSADTFSPNDNCTRAQIVTFLWRCVGNN